MSEIDSLEIKIKSEAKSVSNEISRLEKELTSLSNVLGNIGNTNLGTFSKGMRELANGMQKLQSVKMSDFTRTAKGIEKISQIDGGKLQNVSSAMVPLANSLNVLGATSFDGTGITNFINAITRLANSNVQSLNSANFVTLGSNINKLTSVLQNARNVDSNTIQITNAVARLASAGDKASAVSTALPLLSKNLRSLVNSMSTAGKVSSETIQLSQAIALLANAGKKAEATASGLGVLATELKKFFQVMSTAPTVSGNIIQMTNAIANLANASRGVGNASRSITSGLNGFTNSASRASKGSHGLASAFGKLYATYFLLFRAFRLVGKSIDISSSLTEVQNVVDNTFGDMKYKVEDFAQNSIKQLGMSELSVKQYASRFQAMGTAMGITAEQVGSANAYLEKQTSGYIGMSDSLADVSLNLTKLTADMASFYNMSQEAVAQDLESVYTGMTRPLRQYGLDLTEATLKEWAMRNGLNANIDTMTQAEKTMLRYQYVLANTSAAQGDFARTSQTWANQIRILKEQFVQLGGVVGTAFINMLKPLVTALNTAMGAVINFAETVVNALGVIFGWKLEITSGSLAQDFEDAASGAEDLASGTGKAADNAKKLKQQLQGFQELNVLTSPSDSGSGGGGGAGGIGGTGAAGGGTKFNIVETESAFKSQISNLRGLGEYISIHLTDALKNIDWDEVYSGAKGFGKGLADFLNGLISPQLFGEVGKTLANSLNTAIYSALAFGETFDFEDFGKSIASGINNFFDNFDFKALAKTLNTWVDGIKTTILTALKEIKWSDILKGGIDFLSELDLDTVIVGIAAFKWMHGGKELTKTLLNGLLREKLGTDKDGAEYALGSIQAKISLAVTTAIVGFKIGNWIYNNTSFSKFADLVAKWMVDENGNISIGKALTLTIGSLGISIGTVMLGSTLISAIKDKIVGAVASASSLATAEIGANSIGASIGLKFASVVVAAIAGYGIGTMIYNIFKDEIDSAVESTINYVKRIGSWTPYDPTDTGDADYVSVYNRALELFNGQQTDKQRENAAKVADEWEKNMSRGMNSVNAFAASLDYAEKLGGKVPSTWRRISNSTKEVSTVTGKSADELYHYGDQFKETNNEVTKELDTLDKKTNTVSGSIVGAIGALKTNTIDSFSNMSGATSRYASSMHSNVGLKFNAMSVASKSTIKSMADDVSAKMGLMSSDASGKTSKMSESVKGLITSMSSASKTTIGGLKDDSIAKFSALQTGAISSISGLKNSASGLTESIRSVVVGKFSDAKTGAVNAFDGLQGDTSKQLINVRKLIERENWHGSGVSLVDGLNKGISSKWSVGGGSLISNVISLAKNLTKNLKNAFGIHSPSRVWKDEVGVMLTRGLGAGISNGKGQLLTETASLANSMNTSFFENLELAGNPFDEMQASMTSTSARLSSEINGTAKIESGNLSNDIANGITSGMSMSQAEQNALLREQNELLRQLLSKDTSISANDIFESVKRSNRQEYNRKGTNPLVY